MKNLTFKSVEEWIKSNPSKEEQEQVLNLINRKASSKIRKEVYWKNSELKKLTRFSESSKKLGVPDSPYITERVNKLNAEIKELEAQLPKVEPKKKEDKKVVPEPKDEKASV